MPAARRITDRFAEAAGSIGTLAELGDLVADTTLELGFTCFALVDHPALSAPSSRLFRVDNYPSSWVEELEERGYAVDDPVHLACRRTNAGFGWSELPRLIRLERCHLRILARSRRHGLGGGFTIPANVPDEPSASCSFAVAEGRDLPTNRLHCAELIGIHAIEAARRIRGVPGARPRPRLSRREVECLKLVAVGKTDWEIARILGLSRETARQYVKRARSAYGVVSRTQLVVHGLRDKWISFEDLLCRDALPD